MSNITVTGNEAYFNEDAKFFKDVYVYGILYYDFRKRLLEAQDLKVFGNLDVYGKTSLYDDTNLYGYDNFTYSEQFTTFKNEIVVEKEIKYLRVGILTVSQRFNVGDPDGNVLNADVSTGRVGIGYTDPSQRLDIAGSVKIDDFIYDSINNQGGLGWYLTNDAGGIKWTALNPEFTEGIFVFGETPEARGILVGTGQSFRGINLISASGADPTDLVEVSVNVGLSPDPNNPLGGVNPNPYVADIFIKDFWTQNESDKTLYRLSNVAIGKTFPEYRLDVDGTVRITEDLLVEKNANVSEALSVDGPTFLNNTLTVSGITSLFNNLNVTGITSLFNKLDVSGQTRIFDTLDVSGNTRLNSNLRVDLNTDLFGILTVERSTLLKDTLTVLKLTTLNNGLIVSGISTLLDNLEVYGDTYLDKKLEVSGITTLGNNLFVSGITTLNNRLNVTGFTTLGNNLFVSGITTLNNTLQVSGITTLNSTLYVKDKTVLDNTLDVTNQTRLNNTLSVEGRTKINFDENSTSKDTGALIVEGGVGIEKNLYVGENIDGSGILNIDGDVTFNSQTPSVDKDSGALVVDGGVGIEENLNIGANLNVSQNILGQGTLDIFGTTTLQSTLEVYDNTILRGTLNVQQPTDLDSTLNVDGNTTLRANLNVQQQTDLDSTLNVDGNTTLRANLNVQQQTDLDSTLNVDGETTLNNTLAVGIGGTIIKTTTDGYLGIGTVEPTREVEIARDVKFSAAIYDDNDNVGFRTDQYYEVPRSILSTIGINTDGQIIPGRFFDAANLILLNLDFIAAETVGFLTSTDFVSQVTNGSVDYTTNPRFVIPNNGISSCRNDIKSILKAITFDITKGGNSKSVGAGLSYYDGNTLLHIDGKDATDTYFVQDATVISLNKMAEIVRYVINNSLLPNTYQTPPISGINADAANSLAANKNFIAYQAVKETLDYFSPSGFTIPTGNQRCVEDINLILDGIIYNLTYGGNDRVWDAGNFYIQNPTLLEGEIEQSIYAYQRVAGISSYIINNQDYFTLTGQSGGLINTFIQDYNNDLVADPANGLGYDLLDCAGPRSAINQFVGIVTSAIGISSSPTNSGLGTIVNRTTAGISSIPQVLDLRLQDDVAVGSNMDPDGCSNVVSAIYSCVGIVTTIIKDGPQASPPITYPDGKVVWAPTGSESRHTIWVTKYGNDHNSGKTEGSAKLTIGAAAAVARPGDTIYVRAGIYVEDNPVGLRTDVAVTGQDLRLVNVLPKNIGKDVFHVRRGCTIENLSFVMERADISHKKGGAVAFPPTIQDINSGKSFPAKTGYLAPGPANEGPSGRWRSPYIRNCTNFMKESIGMKIDGNHATAATIGADLKCMVCDSFTQYNENGIGVSITNNGYAQLVSIFTINSDIAIYCDTGGQCDLTNSNSSFGNYGLVADGLGALEFDARVKESTDQETDQVKMFAVTDRSGNIRKPYDGQALYFKIDINGTRLNSPMLSLGSVTVTKGGSGYSSGSPPNVLLIDAANGNSAVPLGPEGIIAELSPTINDDTGAIVSIDVINSGRNYLPPPWQDLRIAIEGGGGAEAVPVMEPIYYTVLESTEPVLPKPGTPEGKKKGKDFDAYNLITKNKELIIDKAFQAIIDSSLPYDSSPVGISTCKRDLGIIIDSVAYNLKYDGTDKVYDAANFYLNNPSVIQGEEAATRVGIETAKIYSIKALRNEYFDPAQFIDNTVIPEPGFGYGTENTCTNQATTVGTFFDIIKASISPDSGITPGTLTTPRTTGNIGLCTVTFNEFIPFILDEEDPVDMFRISRILTSGHSFEYIGTGTDINTSTPQKGGIPIPENQIVPRNGAQIPFTSTNQKGDFEIGEGLIIDQTTRTVRGRDFSRAIQAEVTPLILALR